jgi:hypothetical protein
MYDSNLVEKCPTGSSLAQDRKYYSLFHSVLGGGRKSLLPAQKGKQWSNNLSTNQITLPIFPVRLSAACLAVPCPRSAEGVIFLHPGIAECQLRSQRRKGGRPLKEIQISKNKTRSGFLSTLYHDYIPKGKDLPEKIWEKQAIIKTTGDLAANN